MTVGATFAIDAEPKSMQRIPPPSKAERFEGIGFSPSGNILGIATADTNAVLLFRKQADGRFEETPYWRIGGPGSGLNYPHDVSFATVADTELLAVAQRTGAIALYAKNPHDETFGLAPILDLSGPDSKLEFSDQAV